MPATVVWLAPSQGTERGAASALAEWSIAHGVRLTVPNDEIVATLPVRLAIADLVEEELGHAHDGIVAHDADATERALARAEATLRAHPELPQAAWLMAEVERTWSARWLRIEPRDPDRAARAWQRATGLDGGRIPGVGEASASPSKAITATIAIEGASDFEVRLDGVSLLTESVTRTEGEHALVVAHDGATRFAAWVSLTAGATIRVRVPSPSPCSVPDLARAREQAEGAGVHAEGVRCARWIAVAAGARPGGLRVATCERSSCGSLVDWRLEPALPGFLTQPPEAEAPRKKLPTWASLALFGAGIVVTGTIAIVVADAVRKPEQETRFVNGGIKAQRFGFSIP